MKAWSFRNKNKAGESEKILARSYQQGFRVWEKIQKISGKFPANTFTFLDMKYGLIKGEQYRRETEPENL